MADAWILTAHKIWDRIWALRRKTRLVPISFSTWSLVVTEISQNTLTLTLRRALTLTLESAILAKWLTLTSRSGMLSFVVVPFTNGSPMGMGKMTTFFHPYTSPLSIFFFWIDISPFLKTLSCSCSTGIERGAMQMRCTAPVRRALSNHIIFIAPGFILFPKVGLIRRTGFCWINIKLKTWRT